MQSSICTYPAVGHRQLLTFRVSGADKAPWAVAEQHFAPELHRDRRSIKLSLRLPYSGLFRVKPN